VVAPTLLHPAAEGSVQLNPLKAKTAPPVIRYEAFGMEEDVERMVEGVRRLQSIMSQPAMAALQPTLLWARSLAQEFGEDTDKYWQEYTKRFGFVVYHPTGTCRMGRAGAGAVEEGTVVDPSLRVLGVAGLRVGDASVMPDITSGNTQVPTAAIAVQLVRILRGEY
jgi:choline dehydrogenase